MKNKFFPAASAALCLLLCLGLAACEQKQPRPERPTHEKITSSAMADGEIGTGTVPGDYIFHSVDGVLLKYHIPSGTVSTVCQDPFCTHERYSSSCPFAISSRLMASIGNKLYYVLDGAEGQNRLRSYDGESMKTEQLHTSNGIISRLYSYNYYLYYTERVPAKNEGEYKTTIYRLDTQSGALEVIDCGDPSFVIEFIEAGRIVWKDMWRDDLDSYYSTDLDGDDWRAYDQNCCREWGKYKLRWELGKKDIDKMYCKDLSTGEEILIAENIADFYLYGDKMVYFKFASTRVWTDEYGMQIRDRYGGNVYVMNLDGTNDRLLCHVEDFVYLFPSTDKNNQFVCGDWVGFLSVRYYSSSPENTPALLTSDMLIVNVVTGEYRFIKYNPYE